MAPLGYSRLMSTSRPLWLRWFLRVAIALAGLAIAGFVWLFFLGGIAISDRAMLWRMIRGESVPAPTTEIVASQLRAAPGFEVTLFATDLPSARLMVLPRVDKFCSRNLAVGWSRFLSPIATVTADPTGVVRCSMASIDPTVSIFTKATSTSLRQREFSG